MGDRSRLAVWLFTALAVVVILLVALAPAVLGWRLRAAVARTFPGAQRVAVQVRAAPWAIITGAVDGMDVEVQRARGGQVPVERLSLRLQDVDVDPGLLWRGDPAAITRVGGGEGELILTRADLEQFLASAKGVQRAVLRLEGGVVAVEGDVRVAALDLRVRMHGRLVVASPTTVDLYLQELTVSGVQIPREVSSVLIASMNPLISLEGLPLPMRIESVTVADDEVRLKVQVGEAL